MFSNFVCSSENNYLKIILSIVHILDIILHYNYPNTPLLKKIELNGYLYGGANQF